MSIIYYDRQVQRVWIAQRRIHHGMVGALLCFVGVTLMTHDRQDYREWFRYAHFLSENLLVSDEPFNLLDAP